MNELEPANINAEDKISNVDNPDWDMLKDEPHPVFHQTESNGQATNEPEESDSIEQPEEIDRVEVNLLNDLTNQKQILLSGEQKAYASLADELARSHLGSLARPLNELSSKLPKIDALRFDTLLEYINQKFSLDNGDKEKILEELRNTYYKETGERADTISAHAGDTWRTLSQAADRRFEKPTHHVDNLRGELPNSQIKLADAYFDYFDDPTDTNKRRLSMMVDEYNRFFRKELFSIAESISDSGIGTKELPSAINFGLGRTLSTNYEKTHDALIRYYDHKTESFAEKTAKSSTASESEYIPESEDPSETSSSSPKSLPSDLF